MQSDASTLTFQDQVLTWFDKNKRQVLVGGVAAAVIGTVTGIYVWHQNQVQIDASEALSRVIGSRQFSDAQEGAATELLKVATEYSGTDAAMRAQLIAAGDYFTDGNYKEAQVQFERFLKDYRDSAFAGQALLGSAACKEAQGHTDDAVAAYKDLADHHSTESVALPARLALGRLYTQQNKLEQARDLYQQLAQSDPNGTAGTEANVSLAELFAKHPELIPARPTPTIAPSASPVAGPAVAPAAAAAPASSSPTLPVKKP